MVIIPHAVTGAVAAGILTGHPLTAFVAGLVSHFLLDMIPHEEYPVKLFPSPEYPQITTKDRVISLLIIGTDALAAFVVTLWVVQITDLDPTLVLLGAVGGVMPDVLAVTGMAFPFLPLNWWLKVHTFFHCPPNNLTVASSLFSQIGLTAVVITAAYLFL